MVWACCGQELCFSSVGQRREGARGAQARMWHSSKGTSEAGIVQSYLQTPPALFVGRCAVTTAIFTVSDEHMERSNRNSALLLAVSKPASLNGSFWSAIDSCCPAITATLLIGSARLQIIWTSFDVLLISPYESKQHVSGVPNRYSC